MRILIVEDEPVVARRLERLLGELRPGATLGMADHLEQGRQRWTQGRYDVLFLDLNLHGRDGFELLASAVAGPQQTIVVSANIDRAVEAFDYGVVDFVPKPFTRERLERALDRLSGPEAGEPRARYLAFRRGDRTEVVPVEKVRAIRGADNYAEVELVDGRRLLHDKSLNRLERLLPEVFVRVHRSHIVRLDRIRQVRSLGGSRYRAVLDDGAEVPVGRTRVAGLRDRLT